MKTHEEISEFKKKFWEYVDKAQNILITSHKNPDDDSIGSVLTLYYVLHEKFTTKNYTLAYGSPPNNKWSYFENFHKVQFNKEMRANDYDLVIVLDVNIYERAGVTIDKSFKGKSICIDHHASQPDNFDLIFINKTSSQNGAASNAEILYNLFVSEYNKISKRLAEVCLLGILGDTGWLLFIRPDQRENFSIVKRLVEEGNIDLQIFKTKFISYSSNEFAIMQEFMKNSRVIKVNDWPQQLISYIGANFTNKYSSVEISNASHSFTFLFGLSLENTPLAMIFYPAEDGMVKASFRSNPEGVNVRLIAEKIGFGGGHDLASGLKFKEEGKVLEPRDCLNIVLDWMVRNEPISFN